MSTDVPELVGGQIDETAATERIVSLAPEAIPLLMWEIERRRSLLARLGEVARARAEADGLAEWTAPDGTAYEFKSDRRGEFSDIPALLAAVLGLGASPLSVFGAVSGLCVTDLEAAIAALPAERRSQAAELAGEYRVWKTGPKRLVAKDHPRGRGRA